MQSNLLSWLALCAVWCISFSSFAFDAPFVSSDQMSKTLSGLFPELQELSKSVQVPYAREKLCTSLKPQASSSAEAKKPVASQSSTQSEISLSPTTYDVKSQYSYVGEGFGEFVSEFLRVLRDKDNSALKALLKPRMRDHEENIQKLRGRIFQMPDKAPLQVTYAGIWAVYDMVGRGEVYCPDEDIYLSPLNESELQFFLWVSWRGEKEIIRFIAVVVADKGKLYVGALHAPFWTHAGKDAWGWVKEGDESYKEKKYMLSYIQYTIARKLLEQAGGSYFRLAFQDKIQEFLQQNLSHAQWKMRLGTLFPNSSLLYASTIFLAEGAGIKLRFTIPKEWSSNAMHKHCEESLKTLSQQSWFASLKGVRCAYHLPHETDPYKDGYLGGFNKILKK